MNGSSGLASTPCSAFSSGRRRNRAASYEIPPGCREKFVWTYRQMITFISPGCLTATCAKSKSLMPNSANRSSPIHSRSDASLQSLAIRKRSYPTLYAGDRRFPLAGQSPACAVFLTFALADDWRYHRNQVIRSLGRKARRPEATRCRLFISKPNYTTTL